MHWGRWRRAASKAEREDVEGSKKPFWRGDDICVPENEWKRPTVNMAIWKGGGGGGGGTQSSRRMCEVHGGEGRVAGEKKKT